MEAKWCEQCSLIAASWLSQKGEIRSYRGPLVTEALEDTHSTLLEKPKAADSGGAGV